MPDTVRHLSGAVTLSAPTDPNTIIMLRERRTMSRAALGGNIKRSATFMRSLETTPKQLDPTDAAALSETLHVPAATLTRPYVQAVDLGGRFFTHKYAITDSRRALANANLAVQAITDLLTMPEVTFPETGDLPHGTHTDAAWVAREARTAFGLDPALPVKHLAGVMERYGCILIEQTDRTRLAPAYTLTHPDRLGGTPFVFVDTDLPAHTQRFEIARELGRLINPNLSDRKRITPGHVDDRLDTFALEFLAPQCALADDLDGVQPGRDFDTVRALETLWGVDATGLISRARDLNIITERSRTAWSQALRHAATYDPVPQSYPVHPMTVSTLLTRLKDAGWSQFALAAHLGLHDSELSNLLPDWFTPERESESHEYAPLTLAR